MFQSYHVSQSVLSYFTLPYLTLPYLTLPSGEDVLLPSTDASNGPSAHLRINHKVTKRAVLTWMHTNHGTIPPLQVRTATWAHPL